MFSFSRSKFSGLLGNNEHRFCLFIHRNHPGTKIFKKLILLAMFPTYQQPIKIKVDIHVEIKACLQPIWPRMVIWWDKCLPGSSSSSFNVFSLYFVSWFWSDVVKYPLKSICYEYILKEKGERCIDCNFVYYQSCFYVCLFFI